MAAQCARSLIRSRMGLLSNTSPRRRRTEDTMEETRGPVVVTGAAGYIGSWLVMTLLRRGCSVRATVRDPSNLEKLKPLLDLPHSKELLTVRRADLSEEESFDEVVEGCTWGVPRRHPQAGTVKRVVFTSSVGTVNVEEHPKPEYDESSWSDLDFIRRVKMTGSESANSKTNKNHTHPDPCSQLSSHKPHYQLANAQSLLSIYITRHSLLAPHLEWWFHGPPTCQHMARLLTGTSPDESLLLRPLSVDAFGPTVVVEGHGWVHAWTITEEVVITRVREYFNTSLTVTRLGGGGTSSGSTPRCQALWQSSIHNDGGKKSVPGLMLAI